MMRASSVSVEMPRKALARPARFERAGIDLLAPVCHVATVVVRGEVLLGCAGSEHDQRPIAETVAVFVPLQM
jgi:hypothetical protein